MIWLSYVIKDFEQTVDEWSKFFKVKCDDHFLSIPAKVGTGYCFAQIVNEAMSFVVINVKFNDDAVFRRKPTEEVNLLLHLSQINVGGYYSMASKADKIEFDGIGTEKSIFISSTNYPLELYFSKGTRIQIVGLYFKSSLVRKFLKSDIFHHVTQYSQLRLRDRDTKPISHEEDKLLREIFETNLKDQFGRLVLYNRVLLLVEKVLYRFIINNLPPEKTRMLKNKDLGRLKEVESILAEKKLKKFPSVEELSRVALMSSTKLKKRFKEVYGMKLYEFYNHNRLTKARQSIESGETIVKEAAYRAGYTNISNFSKAFKKEFGFLPSQIKSSS
jgi:AraC-like DNA-binding protein